MPQHPARLWTGWQAGRLRSKLTGWSAKVATSYTREPEYAPARVPCRSAIYDPDHLSRVTACGFNRTVPELKKVLDATSYHEQPLGLFRLGPATLVGGIIHTRKGLIRLGNHRISLPHAMAANSVEDEVVIPSTLHGLKYFGHWLGDDVSANKAFRDHPALYVPRRPDWADVPVYEDLFDQNWRERDVIRARSMILLNDIGFSRGKAERYRQLHARLRRKVQPAADRRDVVFVGRGPSASSREIANFADLEQRLSAAGVEFVYPEGDTMAFLSRILDARVIISIEGSQACHAIYALRDGGGLLVLEPPDRFYAAPHEWMRCMDQHCGLVIGTGAEGGCVINPNEVLAMLDRLMTVSAHDAA
ncbi:MAG: glycosyltransferase family 61 protein [Paracoccus sp. (in: a-proteobacteria)]|nr:glycosyltransferase family 61 protein [Paracoccus sp. (in: a-proteobacteria)]